MVAQHRRQRVTATAFALVSCAVAGAVAWGAGPATTADTPGLAPVPPGSGHYLAAPAAGGKPPVKDRPGPSTVSCKEWPGGVFTQTVDPLSPPCIPAWDTAKGNGGSTSPGVEGNVVRVGVSRVSPELKALTSYFNATYQFYGRSIELVAIGAAGSAQKQNAAVVAAAAGRVFAATDISPDGDLVHDPDAFLTSLATRKIVGVVNERVRHDATLTDNGPHAWSVTPTDERRFRLAGEFVCSTLRTGAPGAGSAAPGVTTRTFAVAVPDLADSVRPDVDALTSTLKACGIDATVARFQSSEYTPDATKTAADKAMYARLKELGVTSVIIGDPNGLYAQYNQFTLADQAGFTPEWIHPGTMGRDQFVDVPKSQTRHQFGVQHSSESEETVRLNVAAFVSGGADPSPFAAWRGIEPERRDFRTLATVAAGIQAAGPRLTPETFAAGLESTRFPNPLAGRLPGSLPHIGFQNGDHTGVRDAAVVWYDPNKPPNTQNTPPPRRPWCGLGPRFGFSQPFPIGDSILAAPIRQGC